MIVLKQAGVPPQQNQDMKKLREEFVLDQTQDAEFVKAQMYIKHKVLGKRNAAQITQSLSVEQLRQMLDGQRQDNRIRL